MTQPQRVGVGFGIATGTAALIVRVVMVAAIIAIFIASFLILGSTPAITADRVATIGISTGVAFACLLLI